MPPAQNKYNPLFIKRLSKNREGGTIIEFALVAPILFLLLMGILEVGLIFFTNLVLEGAANIGSRIGRTGATTPGIARDAYIRNEVRRLSGGYLDENLLDIQLLSYNDFANIGQPEECRTTLCNLGQPGIDYVDTNGNGRWDSDQGSVGPGGANAVTLYRISYPWQVMTPLIGQFFGSNGLITITALATVRNEAFP